MTALSVRRFEPADREAVLDLHRPTAVETPAYDVETADPDLADVRGHYFDADGEFLVGTVDGDVVATIAYGTVSAWREALEDGLDDATTEVRRCRVHPDHRRQGVGSAIYAELERRARADGVETFLVDVGVENEPGRQFFEQQGFGAVGERTVEIEGNPLHLALYRKSLPG